MRRSPRCTYPWMLALDGNTLDGGSLTFSWLSARPRVPRVWPGPLPGPLWIRLAGEEGEVEGRVRVRHRPFLCCRRVAGVREGWPPPGGCRRKSWGFRSCSTPRAAKASPHSPGTCCMCRAGGRPSRRCVRPSGIAGVCCAAVRRWVLQGVLLGEVGPPGVVVVYGRAHSCWRDAHRPALRWEEVTRQPSCRSLPCAWPARDSRRACAAVHRHGRSCGRARLRVLGGVPRVAPGRCGRY